MHADIEACFSRAADSYDTGAEFQFFAAQKLVRCITVPPKHILDIGCGTGILTALLKQKFPHIHATLVDISPQMLAVARQKLGDDNMSYACGSADDTGFITHLIQAHNIDMIVSNLCFQWLKNPLEIIKIYQSYTPLYASVLLDTSFHQWYDSVKHITDDFTPPITVLPYDITHTHYAYHIRYKNGLDFLRTQKNLGTLVNQSTSLTAKQLKNACKIFEENHNATISYSLGIIERI